MIDGLQEQLSDLLNEQADSYDGLPKVPAGVENEPLVKSPTSKLM